MTTQPPLRYVYDIPEGLRYVRPDGKGNEVEEDALEELRRACAQVGATVGYSDLKGGWEALIPARMEPVFRMYSEYLEIYRRNS
jgi:hypothetical protein